MALADGGDANGGETPTRFFCATSLDLPMMERWRAFAGEVPWAHYLQDPAWGEIERRDRADAESAWSSRQPWFFWAERDGALRLTALGMRRPLPLPGRAFWEFAKGPVFDSVETLDGWLPWLRDRLAHDAARLRVAPPVPLGEGGDDVETALERHGFRRRRTLGGWATLVRDISGDEDPVMKSFRSATQRSIKKSLRLGIEVRPEDGPAGWAVLAQLQAELPPSPSVRPIAPAEVERISRLWLRDGAGGTVLVARHQGEPLAAALVITYQGTAHLPLIPSSRAHRDLPATHLLVWEAMRWAKAHGCGALDFSGYSLVAQPGDALWGINQFKRGFAGMDDLRRSVAVHERTGSPLLALSAEAVRAAQTRLRARRQSPAQ